VQQQPVQCLAGPEPVLAAVIAGQQDGGRRGRRPAGRQQAEVAAEVEVPLL
jgi:hypothetical protein